MSNGANGLSAVLLAVAVAACSSSKQGDPGGLPNPDVQPLSENTLVFKRFVRQDPSGAGVFHLFTYDTVSKQEALLTNLDDTGTQGTNLLGHMAISPDRRSIAFAALFRPTTDDLDTGLLGLPQAIWTVSADGKGFTRLTSAFNDGAPRCTSDAECASGTECQGTAGHTRCRQHLFEVEFDNPTWTPDGKTVYFNSTTTWWAGGAMSGGSTPHSVSASGGPDTPWLLTNDGGLCQAYNQASVSPDGKSVLVDHTLCSGSLDGVFLHGVPPSGSGTLLDSFTSGSKAAPQPAEWLPDGSAALYLAMSPNGSAGAIFSVDITTKQVSQIAYAAGLTSFALAPDGKRMVLCVVDSSGQHLLLADRTTPEAPPTPLVENGCHPAW